MALFELAFLSGADTPPTVEVEHVKVVDGEEVKVDVGAEALDGGVVAMAARGARAQYQPRTADNLRPVGYPAQGPQRDPGWSRSKRRGLVPRRGPGGHARVRARSRAAPQRHLFRDTRIEMEQVATAIQYVCTHVAIQSTIAWR